MRSILLFALVAAILPVVARSAADSKPTVASETKLEADGPALLRGWVPPVYPPALLQAKTAGSVTVRFIVDENGVVTAVRATDPSDAAFVDSALVAVKSWRFEPATEARKPVACCLETRLAYFPKRGQEKPSVIPPTDLLFSVPERTTPEPRSSPEGEYPAVLVERKIPGTVHFACTVSTEGRVLGARIAAASHVDFVQPALLALERWEFNPAMLGDLPVQADVKARMTFDSLFDKASEVLAANAITAPDGSPPEIPFEPTHVADPVWPLEPLLAGKDGLATVEFEVTRTGFVRNVRVRDASQPEFGHALAAALGTWSFSRIIGNTEVESVALIKREEFKAVPLDATDGTEQLTRLVIALRRGEVGSAKGLDEKLTPVYRVAPAYPRALVSETGGPAGKADIEFIIDRTGRARLPRIVSATQPEFGWAAATAVAQWVFKAPTRAGEPVDVKVRIPFEFAPDKS